MADQGQGMPLVPPVQAVSPVPQQAPSLATVAAAPAQVAGAVGQGFGAAMARPGLPVASSVASGGANGPTMTPQELLAAKQASVGQAGSALNGAAEAVYGPGWTSARNDFSADVASGHYVRGVADAVRGIGLGTAYAVSNPVVEGAKMALGGLGHFVGEVGAGLFGTTPAVALPAQVAGAPAAAAAAAPVAPAYDPAKDAGLQVASRAATERMQARATPAQTPLEKQMGLQGGQMRAYLAGLAPSQLPGVLATLGQLSQNAPKVQLETYPVTKIEQDLANAQVATPGESAAAAYNRRSAAAAQAAETAVRIANPAAVQPGMLDPFTLAGG